MLLYFAHHNWDNNLVVDEGSRFDDILEILPLPEKLSNMNVIRWCEEFLCNLRAILRSVNARWTDDADGEGRLGLQLLLQKLDRIGRLMHDHLSQQMSEQVVHLIGLQIF